MSVEATFWARRQACTSSTEKCVLLILADYAGADGACWPGQPTVAAQACCSVKSVERALATFEARGWVTRTPRRRPDGYRTSDRIQFRLADNPERPAAGISPDTVSDEIDPGSSDMVSAENRSHPTWGAISPDTMSGLNLLVEPLEDAVAATRAETPNPDRLSDWPSDDVSVLIDLLVREANTVRLDPAREPGLARSAHRLREWRAAGASWNETVRPVVTAFARMSGPPIRSWRFFDAAIADSIACWTDALEIPQ